MVKPGEIGIKNSKVFRGLLERRFHPLLINIILDVAEKYGIMITESYREPRHSGDVHSTNPVRAIDTRHWVYPEWKAKEIERYINNKWEYDFKRPEKQCSRIHKVKGGAVHFHFQAHPRTRRK